MITDEKRRILDELERLKPERTMEAHNRRRRLVGQLARLENRYGEHETHGNERTGRHERHVDSPGYDQMDDESRP